MSLLSTLLSNLAANPWVYDKIQTIFGLEETKQRLAPYLKDTHQKSVLDVGAGTGLYRSLVPPTARYIWLDLELEKLQGFQSRQTHSDRAILGNATGLGLGNRSIDVAMCIAMAHHLSDAQLLELWRELARVVREKIIFLDILDCPDSRLSRLLWKYDRGSFPRSAATILSTSQIHLEVEQVEQLRIYHQLLLCVFRPKQKA